MALQANRRDVVKGAGLALAMLGVPAAARAAGSGAALAVYDPARAGSLPLARQQGGRVVALAGDRIRFWRAALAEKPGSIAGVTNWSDYVIARGVAAEHGLRLRAKGRHGALHSWLIA